MPTAFPHGFHPKKMGSVANISGYLSEKIKKTLFRGIAQLTRLTEVSKVSGC